MNMLELENYLPYLVNRTGQRFVAAFTPSLAMMEVDVQMWRVMSVLYVKGNQSAGELSALTSINLSTLSRLAGRMTSFTYCWLIMRDAPCFPILKSSGQGESYPGPEGHVVKAFDCLCLGSVD